MNRLSMIAFTGMLVLLNLGINAQHLTPYPIPSYNVPVSGNALFEENRPATINNTEAKRKVYVYVYCHRSTLLPCNIKVTIYSLDGLTVLGPFYPACGELLSVDIDDREWGVWVQTDCESEVSVWTSESPDEDLKKGVDVIGEDRQRFDEQLTSICAGHIRNHHSADEHDQNFLR